MLEHLSLEERLNLKAEFDALNSMSEKAEFWLDKFQKPYYSYSIYEYKEIRDFYIHPKTEQEKEEINLICLNEIECYGLGRNPILRLNTEIEKFEKSILKAKNKKFIIEKELERILNIKIKNQQLTKPLENESKSFWLLGYEESYVNQGFSHLSNSYPSPKLVVQLNNGFVIGEYQKFLESKLKDLSESQDTFTKEKTTLKQQILILEFTGLLAHIENIFKTQSAKKEVIKKDLIHFLSVLFNVSEQSLKETLTDLPKKANLYDIRTSKNYDCLIELFETVGLKELSKTVQNEKVKINTKKSTP